MANLTENELDNVKRVLFGLQKQANVINQTVVSIVAKELVSAFGEQAVQTEENVINSIKEFLQHAIDTSNYNEIPLLLMAGEVSKANLDEGGPLIVVVDQPNPESPKHTFRIGKLGEENAEVNHEVDAGTSHYGTINNDVDPDDIVTQTEVLKNKILAVAPESVVVEFNGNDYAAALYLYPSYAKANN